jgi:hypothetical protein
MEVAPDDIGQVLVATPAPAPAAAADGLPAEAEAVAEPIGTRGVAQ